jgi:hypothetical protein
MSIRDEIRREIMDRVGEGRLFDLPPLIPSAAVVRTMFVSKEVNDVVWPPGWGGGRGALRHSKMRGYLDAFTEGRRISVALDPYHKPKSTYLARIDPLADGVWDVRCIDPKPGVRVLGCFAEKDTFVALTFNYRDNLANATDWRDERERCKAAWRKLFLTYEPLKEDCLDEYVSNFFAV